MITQNDINDMVAAANLAGFQVENNQIQLLIWNAGVNTHIPIALENGMQAVYIFKHHDNYLKVGKAGINSQARYRSHHYGLGRANSSLALSLHNDPNIITPQANLIGIWIKSNTTRYNILFDVNLGKHFLNFVEAFFILKCNPLYEG